MISVGTLGTRPARRQRSVLVIEDDERICANIVDLLEAEHFEPLAAADGESGVRLAQERAPAVVLCDLAMRGVDGYDVLRRLRRDPRTRAIPVVFLSARAEQTEIERALALGADDYLTKPFTCRELLDVLNRMLPAPRPPRYSALLAQPSL
jgi:CheY-like chemotaxis protein